ncbi:hypothetical protein [Nonomuraea ceibae]|uniref:hypothetical protein n=1 Tax=Nonomuraea ceibae TaxID=1935170 RepID=UPI001C5E7053|nr:hypothetical protein [Nonomuraea ceibae]
MGVFYDYYRAVDRESAVLRPDSPRAVTNPMADAPLFDAIAAKWIDPVVILGKLVALAKGIPFDSDSTQTVTVYPAPDGAPTTDEEWDALPETSPYLEGPNIEELPVDVRDTLATIPSADLNDIVQQWEQIEEFARMPPAAGYLLEVITGLRGLAQRAQKADQMIYCRISV